MYSAGFCKNLNVMINLLSLITQFWVVLYMFLFSFNCKYIYYYEAFTKVR